MSWSNFGAIVLAAAAAGTITNAEAQSATRSAAPPSVVRDPGDPKAAVPPVGYSSAFSRYRTNAEVEVGSWREKNDDVGRIGGWRVYGREAIADSKAADKPSGDTRAESGATPKPAHGHQHSGAK